MDEAESPKKLRPATSPLGKASPDPAEDVSNADCDAATLEPYLTIPWSDEQLALIRQATGQWEQTDRKEMTDESKAVVLGLLKNQLRAMMKLSNIDEDTEDTVSVAESQPDSDTEKKKQELQDQADGRKIQQPSQDGNCPECHVKTARISELKARLMDQEEEARQHERAAVMHQQDLADAHIVEVRKELSDRINELKAQQSGQTSTSKDPATRPLPPQYYSNDCLWTHKKLEDAKQKSEELDREVEHRKQKLRVLEYRLDQACHEREVLRQRLDEADTEIARLRAQLGPRTSKL